MTINGNKIVRVTKFKDVSNNNLGSMEVHWPFLYVYESIKDDEFWAEYAFIKIPSSLKKMKAVQAYFAGMKRIIDMQPDDVSMICCDDGTKMIQFWWD